MEFLGIRAIEWIRFLELGLGHGGVRLDEFIDCHDEYFSVCFILSCSHVWSIVRCFIVPGVGMERFRWYIWVCGLACSWHGCGSGQMWWSLGSWARISRKVKDGVGIFKSCCYLGVLGKQISCHLPILWLRNHPRDFYCVFGSLLSFHELIQSLDHTWCCTNTCFRHHLMLCHMVELQQKCNGWFILWIGLESPS